MNSPLRRAGMELLGEVPWGTHFCQFYQTPQDLLDVLVGYFRHGLEDNEFCMWITSEPLGVEAARTALRQAVPDLNARERRGQIELLDYRQWYAIDGRFDAERVLRGWVEKEQAALVRGYEGLRLSGNTFWLEKGDWKAFADYEAVVDRVIGKHRMLALCTYSLEKCGSFEVLDVVRNHQFALIKQEGKWERIQSQRHRQVEEALRASEEHRKRVEHEREAAIGILRLINASTSTRQLVEASVRFFLQLSGCEAVGVRLRDGDDYPYYEAHGFPGEFLQLENSLCVRDADGTVQRDHAGDPVMACMCGNVIHGRFDPTKPFFTAAGSFWSNDTTRLLATTTDADRQTPTRNRCNGQGYESVALIRLHCGEEKLGLLQLNDRRKGMFTPQTIALWETLAGYLSVALAHTRAHEAMRRAKAEWEQTFNTVPDFVAILDAQHRVVRANRAMADRLGVAPDQCVGLHCYEAVHGATEPPAFCPHTQTCRDHREHTAEVHELRLGGDYLVSTTPQFDGEGQFKGSVHVARDITERKRAEEALRKSEEQVRLKLQSILVPEGDIGTLELGDIIDVPAIQSLMDYFQRLVRIPMAILDLQGNVLVKAGWHDACTQFHRAHPETSQHCRESDTQLSVGVAPGEFRLYKCKNHMWDIATPIVVGGRHVGNLFAGQFFFEDEPVDRELFRVQARRYRFDEQQYLAALEAAPRLSRESVNAAMGFFTALAQMLSLLSYSNIRLARSLAERDASIADRHRAEESLRDSERRLRTLGDQIPGGAIYQHVRRPDGRVSYAYISAGVEGLVGLTARQVIADPECLRQLVAEEDAARVTAAEDESARALAPFDCEFRHRTVTGQIKWVQCRSMPRRLTDGSIIWDGVVVDVTERKGAEETLKTSLREKEVLLKEIHHRVKNNMQVISSLVALQADRVQDPSLQDVLQDVIGRVRSMALVHEKLYRSADMARVDFTEYVQSLLGYLWRAHGAAVCGIRLSFHLEPVQLSVNAAVPCGLILNELATNAIKHAFHGRSGGEVVVSLRTADGDVCLGVRDDGVGLSPEMDWRHANSLGLRIVQILAGQLRANVEVRSRQGTEWTVTFGKQKA